MHCGYKFYIYIGVLLCLVVAVPVHAQTFTGDYWGDFSGGAKAVCDDTDIDNDNDGLIELCYLEDVNAMRYVLDGSGYKASAMATTSTVGCPVGGCNGYELVRDLDFTDDDSYRNATTNKPIWTTAPGWPLIAGTFSGTLEGNGYTISNLLITLMEGTLRLGFIETLSGTIRNFGLSDFMLTIQTSPFQVAILAIEITANGRIINCYTQGEARTVGEIEDAQLNGTYFATNFVGENSGNISNSYTNVVIINNTHLVASFVSFNIGRLSDSYVTGFLEYQRFNSMIDQNGRMSIKRGTIKNVYSSIDTRNRSEHRGRFVVSGSPSSSPGVLVSFNERPIENSYWDINKWAGNPIRSQFSRDTTDNVLGFDTAKLQESTPSTDTTAPYYNWSEDNWDFGTSSDYPAVKYIAGDDSDDPACDTSQQPVCGILVRGQRNTPPRIIYPTADTQIAVKAGSTNVTRTIPVTVADENVHGRLAVLLFAEDENQSLVELVTTNAEVLPNGNVERDEQRTLRIRVPTASAGAMINLRLEAEDDNADRRKARSEPVLLKVVTVAAGSNNNNQPTISSDAASSIAIFEGSSTTVDIEVMDADNDLLIVDVNSSNEAAATAEVIAINGATRTVRINGISDGTAMITATVDDGRGETNSMASLPFTVRVEANARPTITTDPPLTDVKLLVGSTTTRVMTVGDPNTLDTADNLIVSIPSMPALVDVDLEKTSADTYRLTLEGAMDGNGHLEVVVDDGRGYANSTASVVFTVEVETNEDPMITAASRELLQLGTKKDITVSVADVNYNVDDEVTLVVESGDPDIVLVEAPARRKVTDALDKTFRLNPQMVGTAMLTITATDSKGATDSEDIEVHVNAAPSIASYPQTVPIKTDQSEQIDVVVRDANLDDVLTLELRAKAGERIVRVTTSTATVMPNGVETGQRDRSSELSIEGLIPGETTLTLIVRDGNLGEAQRIVTVIVTANAAPTLTAEPDFEDTKLLVGTTASWVVTVADADDEDTPASLMVNAISSMPTFATVSLTPTGSGTYQLIIEGIEADETEITVSVSDGKTTTLRTFKVAVEENVAPQISVEPSADQVLLLGRTTTLEVVPTDDNFAAGDAVKLEAMSSHNTIVSVSPTTIPGITTDTTMPRFTISADAIGDAVITFTATDNDGEIASTMVKVHVNAAPTISSHDATVNVKAGREAVINVDVSDDNIADNLTLTLAAATPAQSVVQIIDMSTSVATNDNNAERLSKALRIKGLEVGTTVLTLAVADQHGAASAPMNVSVTVAANAAPTLTANPAFIVDTTRLQTGTTLTWEVTVADTDGDDNNDGLSVTAMSGNASAARVVLDKIGVAKYSLAVVGVDDGTANIEVAVDDGRGVSNSRTSETFMVTVETSAAPQLTLTPSARQTLQLGEELAIEVVAMDANYDVRDKDEVTLEAKSSNDDIVSVSPPTIANITDATTQTFTIRAATIGDATITFTATDILKLSDTEMLDVHVNEAPKITQHDAEVTAINGRPRTINVELSDNNVADTLTVELVAVDTSQQIVRIVDASVSVGTNNGVVRMPQALRIEGIADGTTTLTIVVTDGQGGKAEEKSVVVTSRMNAEPTIDGLPEEELPVRSETSQTVMITVADADDDDAVGDLVVSATSSDADVASVVVGSVGGGSYGLIITAKAMIATATITVSVDDGNNESNSIISESFVVSVVAGPVVIGGLSEVVIVVPVDETSIVESVDYFNALSTSTLSYTATGVPADRFSFSTPTGVLTISPEAADISTDPTGTAIMVTAEDNFGMATLTFKILVDAAAEGGVTIAPSGTDKWLLEATNTVTDANNGSNPLTTAPRYQWYRDDAPVGDGSASYTIENTADGRAAGTTYRVAMVYTDNIGEETPFDSNTYTVANIAPTITTEDSLSIRVSEGASTTVDVEIADENLDTLNLVLESSNETTATATIVETSGAKRTLRINGLKIGEDVMITATVNDGKGETAEVVFMVGVVANEAPTITLIPASRQILQLNSTTSLAVMVTDTNFDANDIVTLKATSNLPSVVEVMLAEFSVSKADTETFILEAKAVGDADITVVATDRKGEIAEKTLEVHVNAAPMIVSDHSSAMNLQIGRVVSVDVIVTDANTDDDLTLELTAVDPEQSIVEIIDTRVDIPADRAQQNLKIKGLGVGTTTLTIVVSDDSAEDVATVVVKVTANAQPVITTPLPDLRLLQGTSKTSVVTVTDADSDDPSDEFTVTAVSDNDAVKATVAKTDNANYDLKIEAVEVVSNAMIEVVADDGRAADNSKISRTFTVAVVANEAPTITISPTDDQILPLDEMLELSVSVEDANYDVDDEITITVTSQPPSAIKIDPAQIDRLTTSDTQTIRLTAEAGGNAILTITAEDSQSESTSTTLSLRVEAPPMIATIDAITADEGNTVTIDPEVSDANNDELLYAWRVVSGDDTMSILQGVATDTKELEFTIPDDYIEDTDDDSAMQELIFELKVTEVKDNNPASTTQTVAVAITKIDNADANLGTITVDREDNNLLMFPEIDESSDADGEITTSTIIYQWQRCTAMDCIGWNDLGRGTSHNIDENTAVVGDRYRMEVTYTDGQGYTKTLYSTEHTYTTGIRIRTKVYLEGPLR